MNKSYNEMFYSANLENTKRSLGDLLKIQRLLLKFLINFLDSASGVFQTNNFPEFLKLIATIRLNIESVNHLLPLLNRDYRFKTSINLIYRSMVGDLITLNYLKGFIDETDVDQISLGNELNIFNKEYLLSSYEGLLAENEYNINNYKLNNEVVIDEIKDIELRNIKSQFLDENGKWIFNSKLRSSTSPDILVKIKNAGIKDTNKGFISENEKIKFLKEINSDNHLQLKFLFKYYSQFQHFSPSTFDLINSDLDYTLNTYKTCIYLIIRFLKDSLELFNVKDFNHVVDEFLATVNIYNEIYQDKSSSK
ncbi:MAG TPA: hypothetical protein VL442_23515 [Mucilaginibacter sp.]|jgi:hypothetical protein|nr:hypothetical protein [Mucilaginibacter sp.]